MQVFKLYFKIAKSKWLSILIYFVIFLMILSLTNAGSGATDYTSTKMRLTVYDKDGSAASKKLVEYIGKNNELQDIKDDKDVIIDALYVTSTNYVITINEGFGKKLESGETGELFEARYIHDSYTNKMADEMLNTYVSTVRAYMAGGESLADAQAKASEALSEETEVKFKSFSKEKKSPAAAFFNYLPYAILSMVVSIMAPVMISMNKGEVAFRTRCSSMTESAINFQTFLASMVSMVVIWLVLMLLGISKNEGMYSGNMWYAVLNAVAFTIVSAGIAILLSVIGVSENVLAFLTQILGLGMAFLCGMFVPFDYLSKGTVAIGRFLPAYWYVKANEMICGLGDDVFRASKVMQYIGVEMLFALALFALAFTVKKQKRSIKG